MPVQIFGTIPDMMTLKKSKMFSNWPKWLVVAQSVLFGNEDLEIRSYVSSFSGRDTTHRFLQPRLLVTIVFLWSLCFYAFIRHVCIVVVAYTVVQ